MSPMSLTSVLRGKLSREGTSTTMQRRALPSYSRYDTTLQLSINRPFKLSPAKEEEIYQRGGCAQLLLFSPDVIPLPTPIFRNNFPRTVRMTVTEEGGRGGELEIGNG